MYVGVKSRRKAEGTRDHRPHSKEREKNKGLVTRERTVRKRPAKMHLLTDAGVYAVAQGAIRVFTRETFWRTKRTVAGRFHRDKAPISLPNPDALGLALAVLIRTVRDSAGHGCMGSTDKWPNICIAGPTPSLIPLVN